MISEIVSLTSHVRKEDILCPNTINSARQERLREVSEGLMDRKQWERQEMMVPCSVRVIITYCKMCILCIKESRSADIFIAFVLFAFGSIYVNWLMYMEGVMGRKQWERQERMIPCNVFLVILSPSSNLFTLGPSFSHTNVMCVLPSCFEF
jgi:hypothetical protein